MSKILEKVQKELPEFVEECANLTAAEIDTRLSKNAQDLDKVEVSEEEDEEYQAARDNSRELGAPYRDAKKVLKLKSKYLISLLKERA